MYHIKFGVGYAGADVQLAAIVSPIWYVLVNPSISGFSFGRAEIKLRRVWLHSIVKTVMYIIIENVINNEKVSAFHVLTFQNYNSTNPIFYTTS